MGGRLATWKHQAVEVELEVGRLAQLDALAAKALEHALVLGEGALNGQDGDFPAHRFPPSRCLQAALLHDDVDLAGVDADHGLAQVLGKAGDKRRVGVVGD